MNKKDSTYVKDRSIMRFLDKEFEGKHLDEITTWDIEKYKVKRKRNLKPISVSREITLMKHLLSKAVEWGKLKENPGKIVKHFKGATKRLRYLMPDETNILLSNCDGLLHGLLKPLVTLALHTGARQEELMGLKWPQVDFQLGVITLLDTKNGERRDIPMNETVKTILEALERKSEYVFPCTNGNGLNHARIHIGFHEALMKSKIEDFHFHDLRHTFASNLVMAGAELNDARELLGHKSMEMTLRYAHLSPKHKGRVITILDRVFDSPQNRPQAEKAVWLWH